MEFSKGKIRQIRHLMLLAAALVLAIIYSSEVFRSIAFLFGIISPFLVGGAMAFVLNIPMRGFNPIQGERMSGGYGESGEGGLRRNSRGRCA